MIDERSLVNRGVAMSTEKSNGGPFVMFREECEILRARVVELEAQLEEATTRYQTLMRISQERVDKRDKLILLAKDALEKVREVTGSNTFAHNYADEALAAIDNDEMLKNLILCGAEPIGEIEVIDVDEDAQPSAWIRINTDVELGDQLYAPRRTEK